ncbi:MKRN2 opposite strand protein [Oncorhynchus clarkii lewisi]|uniref:MKRN2 opposite strand protein n=1 Tax=Oncorhynchus clarkii lewisi TaxID=490388 RepID=UPI0039B9C593
MEEKSVIKFSHCQKDIFCFFIPEKCPECGVSFSSGRLEEAPIRIPNPFSNGHKTPCCFLVAPAEENNLREFDGGSDLHTGITDTNGVVFNYTKPGVRQDQRGWEMCISIPLIQPDMFNLLNQWDQYLNKFSDAEMWDPAYKRFNKETHNCYNYTLMFLNRVLATQGKGSLTKDQFTQSFVLPKIKRACKYTTMCREISQNYFYIADSPVVRIGNNTSTTLTLNRGPSELQFI